jgi:NAD(P)-dependent dehydrogenase (short-subunit alcohol dehydrogenase family)
MERRLAVVTGANRGIGEQLARELGAAGYIVLVGARNAGEAARVAGEITAAGGQAEAIRLDVTRDEDVAGVIEKARRYGRWDVLVNNAAVMPDDHKHPSLFDTNLDAISAAFETNTIGPMRMIRAAVPFMRDRKWGRIVNVSTGMASLTEMNGGYPAYRLSKTAMQALTRIAADELKGTGILVNTVCPGWVKSRMGGERAPRSIAQGAASVRWAIELPDDGPSGGFFRDGKPVAW